MPPAQPHAGYVSWLATPASPLVRSLQSRKLRFACFRSACCALLAVWSQWQKEAKEESDDVATCLKQLEDENKRLKKLYANLSLDYDMLQTGYELLKKLQAQDTKKRQIFIRSCGSATTLDVKDRAKLETYFSQSVDLGDGYSVGGGTAWRVRYYPACP